MVAQINTKTPMGAARYVRRERYAWPGGYALALVMTDGALLCPDCVAAEYRQISYSARHKLPDGWAPAGVACENAAETEETCAHCGKIIFSCEGVSE